MSIDWEVPTYSDGDAEFDRLLAIGTEEANEFLAWLGRNPGETLSPFARRALAHSFGHVIDRISLPTTSVSEPVSDLVKQALDYAEAVPVEPSAKELIRALASALTAAEARAAEAERQRDIARQIVRDIHWMAVRYADGRKSYAPGMLNDALRKAYDAGWLKYDRPVSMQELDPQYAREGAKTDLGDLFEAAEAKIAALEHRSLAEAERVDAGRWRALMSSQKMHFMGSAGFQHTLREGSPDGSRLLEDQVATPKPGEPWHFGMEFWFGIPADARYPDTFERQMLTSYVDAISATPPPTPRGKMSDKVELVDGQIYRWRWAETERSAWVRSDPYWCKSCIAIVKGGKLYDTYWSDDRFIVDSEKVVLTFMGSEQWPQLREGEELRYDRADICDTRHANRNHAPIYVRPGAQLNKGAMLAVLDEREEDARSTIRSAEWRLEEIARKRALLESDKLNEVYL